MFFIYITLLIDYILHKNSIHGLTFSSIIDHLRSHLSNHKLNSQDGHSLN